jgi:hypothetical protein
MMIPDHCKDVSIRRVEFDLDADEIALQMKGRKAYTRTDHLILANGNDMAVIWVIKENTKELFKPIIGFEIVSLPDNTIFVKDEEIDVLNLSHLARLADTHPGKVVVVEGMFNHVSFVKDILPIKLRVLDAVPPRPSKLSCLVERALASGYIGLPILPVLEEIDLNELAKDVTSEGVIFPCKASNTTSDKRHFFLDETPELDIETDLIGCDLSARIFRSIYRKEPELINICPWDLAPRDGVPTIVKCCKVKSDHVIDENIVVVQWGASVREVTEAINAFFDQWKVESAP